MKRIFTFVITLMSMLAALQPASAANVVFTVTVPSPTYQVWMVGSFQGWNPAAMVQGVKVDDTHYTVTLDDATFAAGVTKDNMEYKYSSGNGDWSYIEKKADGGELAANRKYADSNGTDVVLKWAAVYNPTVQPKPLNVTISVLTPVGTIECYIVGNFNNWAGPTALADSIKMTKLSTNPDGTVIFEKTVYSADANKLAYHFCSGPDWSFEQKAPTGDYKYPDVAVVVTEWKKVFDPSKVGTINITATVPAGTEKVWIQGSYLGWNMANAVSGTKNLDGTFSFTAPFVLDIEYRLYNAPDWSHPEADETDPTKEHPNRLASFPANATTAITVTSWKTPAALTKIQGESYNKDVTKFLLHETPQPSTYVKNMMEVSSVKDFATYDNIYLDGQDKAVFNVSSTLVDGNKVEIHLGTATGALLGTLTPTVTANWDTFTLITVPLTGVPTGMVKSSIVLVAAGGTGGTSIDWFELSKTTTGIKNLKNNVATNRIYNVNSSIVVEGVTSRVDVFDLSGRILQSNKLVGTFTSKSLNTGIYIVRVDGATKKVAVK